MGLDPAVPFEKRPGIRTFLIADVRGYTSFTQERGDEEGTELAARFAAIAREVINDEGGAVIELRGDEVLAEFDSARGAIHAATSLQQRFLEETEADPRLPLPVGIGLDAGEAVPYESGYRGGALNLASRLCGRAGPGEVLVSQGVVLLARTVEGVRLVDRGELQLKGLKDRVRVFRAIPEGSDPAERIRVLTQGKPARGSGAVRLARRHPLWAAAIALALAATVVVPITLLVGEGSADPITGDALAMVDLVSGKVEGSVSLDGRPGDVAVGAGGVWVTVPDRGVVMRIDRESMTVRNTIPVGAEPSGIAVGEGSVWVSNGGSSTVSRISPETETVVETIDVPGGPAGIAVGFGGVWVANSFGASVSRIDPRTGDLLATIGVGDRPVDVAIGDDAVWVANAASDTISRIDPAQNEVQQTRVGKGPLAIASGPSGIWVANTQDGTVSRIDPGGDSVAQTIEVDGEPTDLALTEGSVWVADGSLGSVSRIDITSGSREKIELGPDAGALGVGEDAMWVSVRGSAAAHRGGTLTVWGGVDLLGDLDPALGYYAQSWAISTLTNDGLVGFRRTGGIDGTTLVPNLARSLPEPSPDGKTYTFHLRPGIRYSDGSSLRPEDFRRAIERVFAQIDGDGNRSGGVQFFTSIVGAEECEPAKACDLSDGILTDDDTGTVTFRLTKADPDFLYKLALPFAFAVPAETPDDLGNGAIPATGPYVIESFVDGERIVLSRNPQFRSWSEAARPEGFPDRIVWKLGSDLDEMAGRVLKGDADLMFALPTAESFDQL
ncbi:MAG: hypothetical protein QOH90_64, partial [Actinomycetota bacterium]|nr:hypothetical protein [Actinomycetota bacterium]